MFAHPARRGLIARGSGQGGHPAAPARGGRPGPGRGPVPDPEADEVADAPWLAGLCLGEVVCVPGLQGPSMIGTSRQGDHLGGAVPRLSRSSRPSGDACQTLTFRKGIFR